jgi:hypothetical protein
MMPKELKLLFQVSDEAEAVEIADATNRLLQESSDEVREILRKYKLPESQAEAVLRQRIEVSEKGAGSDPATIALLVALTPLLKPFARSAAKVAEKVALDIWAMLKEKLWTHEHLRFAERKEKQSSTEVKPKAAKPKKKS